MLVQLGPRESREHAAAIGLPFLFLLKQQCSDKENDRGGVGKHADDARAAFELLVEQLERVGAPDLALVLWREGPGSEDVLPGLPHQRGRSWECLRDRRNQLIPLLLHSLDLDLHEHRTSGRQRRPDVPRQQRAMAFFRRTWASLITGCTPVSMRSCKRRRNAVQKVSFSLFPTPVPNTSR